MKSFPDKRTASSGMALILVLWVLVLMTIMAGSFSLTMRREISVVHSIKDLAQTSALSEAGINFAMLMLLHPDKEQKWQSDGSLYEFQFSGAKIRVSIIDESGKIEINNVDEELMRGILEDASIEDEQQDRIIDAILDWTDNNDLVRLHGAEKDDYQDLGLSYGPPNKKFQVVDELQLIVGMQTEIYSKLRPVVTVYSGQKKINLKNAPKEVLLALPDATEESVDEYLQQKAEHVKDGLPAPDFPWAESSGKKNADVYTINAQAMLANGATGSAQAVVKLTSGSRDRLPFTILEWNSDFIGDNSLFSETKDTLVIN